MRYQVLVYNFIGLIRSFMNPDACWVKALLLLQCCILYSIILFIKYGDVFLPKASFFLVSEKNSLI